jgi:hypothetical protein
VRRSLGLTALLAALIVARTISSSGGQVKSSYWKVAGRRVPSGSRLRYCSTRPITLTPVDELEVSIPSGAHYGYQLFGPASAGDSAFTNAGQSSGGVAVVSPSFSARDFPALHAGGARSLTPGTYTYLLRVNRETVSRLTLVLVAKTGC